MSRHFLTLSAAALAIGAGVTTASMAQDAAPAADALPAPLAALNLQDIETKEGRRGGRKIEADLPGGGEIEAWLDDQGGLRMVEVEDVAMPQSLVEAMLPQAVRDSDILSQFAVIDQIGGRDGRVMVGGEDSAGEDLRAGFDQDGRLLRFGRDDDDGRRERRGGGQHDRMGDHDRGKGGHGKRGGDQMGQRHGGDQMGEGRGGGRMRMMDNATITEGLDNAGYTDLGEPRPAGPRMILDAVNAAGEAVTVEVDAQGEVIREIAR